jgi:hypothetical protein
MQHKKLDAVHLCTQCILGAESSALTALHAMHQHCWHLHAQQGNLLTHSAACRVCDAFQSSILKRVLSPATLWVHD